MRSDKFKEWLGIFDRSEGGLLNVARSYNSYGLHINSKKELVYKEWAPEAHNLTLFGDFNNWNRNQYYAHKNEYGQWTLTIPPNAEGEPAIKHG